MKISVRVIFNSKNNEIQDLGFDENGLKFYKIRVNQLPIKGKANKELVKILAEYLNIKKSDISIVSGLSSQNKIINIKD